MNPLSHLFHRGVSTKCLSLAGSFGVLAILFNAGSAQAGDPRIGQLHHEIEQLRHQETATIKSIEAHYDSGGYGQFKTDVAEAVIALFEPIQTRFNEIRGDTAELTRLLGVGADKARELSAPTLAQMYAHMGFVPRV